MFVHLALTMRSEAVSTNASSTKPIDPDADEPVPLSDEKYEDMMIEAMATGVERRC